MMRISSPELGVSLGPVLWSELIEPEEAEEVLEGQRARECGCPRTRNSFARFRGRGVR